MDEPPEADEPRVLDSPALRRVLAALTAAGQPLSAAQLAQTLELHVTTVRSHLDQLERAG
ncbi:MAG: helix-turn-helix transcriptional regulator, partial [Propionibacteriaceae bacterium]|nr:helix-turn-helix transcriptional regulator [Propionibacteriaceae bacterium]